MNFTREEIYSTIGRYDNVATFYLKEGTESYNKYGEYVTGIPIFKKREREELESNLKDKKTTYGSLRIRYLLMDRDDIEIQDLNIYGINICHIKDIAYSKYNTVDYFNHEGTKKINETIIPIEFDASKIKYSSIFYSLISTRLAHGKKLIFEEIVEFLALNAFVNNLRLSTELLKQFELTQSEIENNYLFWFYYYKFKEDESTLTKFEAIHYETIKNIRLKERYKAINKELKVGLSKDKDKVIHKDILIFLSLQAIEFKTSRLLQIKVPVYWDFESFLHIYIRHVQELQIGKNFKNKSYFKYRMEDIKRLIEVVLSNIEDEIINHFSKVNVNKFTRHGNMSVYYQGDYYCIDISANGRLENFYKTG